jgi:hypothetical protein
MENKTTNSGGDQNSNHNTYDRAHTEPHSQMSDEIKHIHERRVAAAQPVAAGE